MAVTSQNSYINQYVNANFIGAFIPSFGGATSMRRPASGQIAAVRRRPFLSFGGMQIFPPLRR
jgi:hypothetical protein